MRRAAASSPPPTPTVSRRVSPHSPRHPRPRKNSFILAAERVSDFASEFTEGADDAAADGAGERAADTPAARNARVLALARDAEARASDAFAPLLSRVETTRLLEGARALLRSLGGFLDAPARMRVAARERRWVDAVKHYRRAHALPSSYRSIALLRDATRDADRVAHDARGRLVGALRLDAPAGEAHAAAISCLLELGPPEADGAAPRGAEDDGDDAPPRDPAADADAEPEDAARADASVLRELHPAACALDAQLSHLRRHLDEARAATLLPRARQNARPRH